MGVLCAAGRVERVADGGDAAVHHVAGRDDVGAGLGEAMTAVWASSSSGGVVVDVVMRRRLADDDAAVAVAGVLAEADVGDEDERLRGGGLP